MDVSVIIVTYNTLQMTDECITSIVEKTKRVSYEIILVDNASTDGSKEFFEKDDRVTYIYNEENYGFGKANNVGASVAKGKYLFFLNSDTYLINDAIDKLFETRLSMSKNVGFIGGVLYDKCGVLNSSKSAETGLDLQGINTEIIMYTNSSKIRKTQVLGRALRAEEGKNTEIFTLILRGTQEYNWFQNSNTSEVIYINEDQLDKVLAGNIIETREHDNIINTKFRF